VQRGDLAAARAVQARLLPSFAFINSDECVFSMSIKAMLRTLGHDVGECRLPLPPAPAGTEDAARKVWQQLQRP
jgi:4-hydroxy-tetrahydrodipicolinate synthase